MNSHEYEHPSLEHLLNRLKHIGIMLSAEKDTNKLIALILNESMEIVGCDAGSVYIRDQLNGEPVLKFMQTQNSSRQFQFNEDTLPIDQNSVAGYCAGTGMTYIFNNMSEIPKQMNLKFNDYFDKETDYHTKNMMVIPMKDIENEVVGVLQLINKKKDFSFQLITENDFDHQIVPFTVHESDLIASISSQAAMLLERSLLLENIEKLFDNFVESMVQTIDKRDPTTSGHSIWVAKYVKAFLHSINEDQSKSFKDVYFSADEVKEIYFASLLHDIGKIGVKESLLCKRNKISTDEMETIKYRFHYYKKSLELDTLSREITEEESFFVNNIEEIYSRIMNINHAIFLTAEDEEAILKCSKLELLTPEGNYCPLLKESELENLLVKYGNLNHNERELMNLHAEHTFEILKEIPWPPHLRRIPLIAAAHHEKLDGTGYPNQLKWNEIMFESKVIAIADIFEALTAVDRPYRKSLSHEKAVEILKSEANMNHLDTELVNLFINERVFEKN